MSTNFPSISVFIPTYNYGSFLPRALDSVFSQSMQPLEIIVADDGSTDNTEEIVARYGGRVRYRRFDHAGVYTVRQAMLAELRGDWFLNLDADNWLDPDFLENALAITAKHRGEENFAFVYPDRLHFGKINKLMEVPEFDPERLKKRNVFDMNSLIRTDVARRFGFDSAFNDGWGDYDFFLTLVENGFVGERMSKSQLHYCVHAGSLSLKTPDLDRRERLMKRMVAKHTGFFNPEEAVAAVRGFSAHKALMRRIDVLRRKGRYGKILRLLLHVLRTNPSWLRSPK